MRLCSRKDRILLCGAILLGGISAALSAFVSVLLQQITDVAAGKDLDGFTRLFFIMLTYLVVLGVVGFAEAYCGKRLLRNVSQHLREDIFRGVMKRSPSSYHAQNTADYLSALVNDVKMIEENYLVPLLLCSQMIVLFLTTLGILLYLSPLVTGILLVFLVLMFLVPSLLGKHLQERQEMYSEKFAEFTARTKDYLNGYEIIQGYSIFPYIYRKFLRVNKETAARKFSADTLLAVNESFSDILSSLSVVMIVFLAAYLMLKGNITMGTLLALIQLSGTFVTPVVILMQNAPKIAGIKPVLERLLTLKESREDGEDSSITDTAQVAFEREIRCSDVTFGYEPGNPVLKQMSIRFEAGKKYALLGNSGCGKSTLIKLLTGYSQDYEGTIFYDGKSIADMSQAQINSLVSVIHQNVFLFDTDIRENICLGGTYSDEELQQALEESGIMRFLPDLENGLDTQVGENGKNLSGGQKQRIAVARALIRKTPILIIDEGTSAVDIQTAYEIEQKLLKKENLTVLCITHHMNESLKTWYDEIFYMEDGQ